MSKIYAIAVGSIILTGIMFVVMVHYIFLADQAHASGRHVSVLQKTEAPSVHPKTAKGVEEKSAPLSAVAEAKQDQTAYMTPEEKVRRMFEDKYAD